MKVLLTGAAGFIGRATAEALLKAGRQVVAVDNLNDYYAVSLKHARLATLREQPGLQFYPLDVADWPALDALFAEQRPDAVIHLAAQAGCATRSRIRMLMHSQSAGHDPYSGSLPPTSGAASGVRQLVVGVRQNAKAPFAEDDRTDQPVSFTPPAKKPTK